MCFGVVTNIIQDEHDWLYFFVEPNLHHYTGTTFNMDWQRLDNKKASRIIYYIGGLDFDNHENYDELINEVINKVIAIRNAFRNRL